MYTSKNKFKKLISILILLIGLSATSSSQTLLTLSGLTQADKRWLSDSSQTETAKALADGHACFLALGIARREIIDLNLAIKDKDKSIVFRDKVIKKKDGQILTLQADIDIQHQRIKNKDNQIAKLQVTQWLVVGVSVLVVTGTIIIATQVK